MKIKKLWWIVLLILFLAGCWMQFEDRHVHDEDCYVDSKQLVLNCDYKAHEHAGDCYDVGGNLVCRESEFIMHRHDNTCFDTDCKLVCELCQVWWDYQDVLLCNILHEHVSDCYENRRVLIDLDDDRILRVAGSDGWFDLQNLHEHQHTAGAMCFDICSAGRDDILICHELDEDA